MCCAALRACAEPGNDGYTLPRWASRRWTSLATLERLNEDERPLGAAGIANSRIPGCANARRGLPMLHRLLHDFDFAARLLQQPLGQRQLTNLFASGGKLLQTCLLRESWEAKQALVRKSWLKLIRLRRGSRGRSDTAAGNGRRAGQGMWTFTNPRGLKPAGLLPFILPQPAGQGRRTGALPYGASAHAGLGASRIKRQQGRWVNGWVKICGCCMSP